MNIIEILGYITLYFLVGVVLLPFYMIAASLEVTKKGKRELFIATISWPVVVSFLLIIALVFGWSELKNHK